MLTPLPTISLPEVFHTGTLNIKDKNERNLEGNNGLSVTNTPGVWGRINRGMTSGDDHKLTKTNNSFIDYHEITKEQHELIEQWGVDRGLLTPLTKYQYSYYDDEYEQEMTFVFDSKEEAEAEAEEEHEVTAYEGFSVTDKLCEIIGSGNKDDDSLIIIAYCLLETECDGVFWNDILDVTRLSAPRGVILQSKLESWSITKQ